MIHQTITIKKGTGSYRPTPDVTVISDELIRQATKKYYEENKEEYKITNLDTLPFNELRVLNLSFQEIYKIQNLDGLNKLEELRLDNNKIKKIENIGHLVHLKWLDLSFNVIEKIEGLDKLTKLHDLSLYSNQIKEVEGLDNCTELNVLSIGNNLIEKYDKMLDYLEKFRKLEVFNVLGNPFTKREQEYDLHIIFRLKNLKYLNYSFIDDAMKNKLEEKDEFKGARLSRQQELKQLEERDRNEREKQDQLKKLKEAKVDTLDAIVPEILLEQESLKLKEIRGSDNEIQKFIMKFNDNALELKAEIVRKNEAKLEQIKKFMGELEQRIAESEDETKAQITAFQKRMKNTFRKFEDPDYDDETELLQLRDDTEKLESELINIEMQFIEMEDNGIKDFGYKLDDCIKDMSKVVVDMFEKFKADQNVLKNNLNKITQEEIDRYNKYVATENAADDKQSSDDKPFTEDQADFFDDSEGVLRVVGQFNENVEGKIFKKETEITDAIGKFTKDFTDNLKEKQYERNRRNINNIANLILKLREQIENQLVQNNGDDGTNSNR